MASDTQQQIAKEIALHLLSRMNDEKAVTDGGEIYRSVLHIVVDADDESISKLSNRNYL